MDKKLYLTGEFARKANVSVRTIHYYEKMGLIHPEKILENGYRCYGEEEFARLQRILTLKLLGFSLEEIQELSIHEENTNFLQKSFEMQLSLVRRKIEHLRAVEKSIQDVSQMFLAGSSPDWEEITKLIRMVSMDKELVEQYKNGQNIEARIRLHSQCSHNAVSWFSWIFQHMELKAGMRVLELGCGNGMLWKENAKHITENTEICLTDISSGMLDDTRKNLEGKLPEQVTDNIQFQVMDAHHIGKEADSFDVVVANFLMFYLKDVNQALSEIRRVLKEGGRFICATYGENHMREVEELVREFNPKIRLSSVRLYENFGMENGKRALKKYFGNVQAKEYPDYLEVRDAALLSDYILSCHGNQREYLVPVYDQFFAFLEKKIAKKGYLRITKQAGIFIAS